MNCLRCGKEIDSEKVFCEECLTVMENQPVEPGTPINLPKRDDRSNIKRASFQLAESKWHDRIFRLKYTIFWLIVIIILLLAAVVFALCMLLHLTPEWINEMFYEAPAVQNIIERVQP